MSRLLQLLCNLRCSLVAVLSLSALSLPAQTDAIRDKVICIDPGHGGTADSDHYRVGPTGEREEWVNLRVGLYLKKLLEDAGATVLMTRTEDVFVPLQERAQLAIDHQADLFLSIHHNATADTAVNYPVIYFHGHASENRAGVAMAHCMAGSLLTRLYGGRVGDTPVSIVSDHTIFPQAGAAVLRHSYGIPALIVEASFFTNPAEENRLKQIPYNKQEAEAYLQAVTCFFENPVDTIYPKYSTGPALPPLKVLQEAERMDGVALAWQENYLKAKNMIKTGGPSKYEEACELLLQSVTSFPDSFLAGDCLELYASLLRYLGKDLQADEADRRRREYYVRYLQE